MISKDSIVIAKRENKSVGGYIALGILFFVIGIAAGAFFVGIDDDIMGCSISIIIGLLLGVLIIFAGVKASRQEENVVLYDKKNNKLLFYTSENGYASVEPSNIAKARAKMEKEYYTTFLPSPKRPMPIIHSYPSGRGKLKIKLIHAVDGHYSFSYSRVVNYCEARSTIDSLMSGGKLQNRNTFQENEDDEEQEAVRHEKIEKATVSKKQNAPLLIDSKKSIAITEDRETGIRFDGDVSISSYVEIDGNVRCTGNLKIGSSAKIYGYVSCDGNLEIGNYAEIEGNVKANGDITIGSNSNVYGTISSDMDILIGAYSEVEETLHSEGNIAIKSSASIADSVTCKGTLIVASDASIDGSLKVDGDADIAGEAGEDVVCKGNFILRAEGSINGDVKVGGNAKINGEISGDLSVGKDVGMSLDSAVYGDVEYCGCANINGEVEGEIKKRRCPKEKKTNDCESPQL